LARLAIQADRQANADSRKASVLSSHQAVSVAGHSELKRPRAYRIGYVMLGGLIILLAIHGFGACLDFLAGICDPNELDYGEGIVWQQAVLIPGPHMYATRTGLPFIVFHYPPIFYLLVWAIAPYMPDLLSAGRLISAVAAVSIVPLVAALVLASVRRSKEAHSYDYVAIAIVAGFMALSLHAVRTWGLFMRVDMVAIALGLAGVLVAARADGKWWGTTCALLLCVASVYCKQTQLPAGIAIFVVVLLRRPRAAIGAAAIALTTGLTALATLQWFTAGGFLHNVIGDNINRFALQNMEKALWLEHTSFPFMVLMLVAASGASRNLLAPPASGSWHPFLLRFADRATATRAILLLHFILASLMLVTMFKSGADFNYLLDWLCVGCVLTGVWVCDLWNTDRRFPVVVGLMILCLLALPIRQMPNHPPQSELDRREALVRRVAATDKPVASENMTLLMRAGKSVIFEPAIATELASLGRGNEQPLVNMIDSHGFAFMITTDDSSDATVRRTPAVNAAMRRAYPRVEQVDSELWLHLPPN
jgi:hypothetical protein